MNSASLAQVLRKQRLVSLRAGAIFRVSVVIVLIADLLVETNEPRWLIRAVLLGCYTLITVVVIVVAFTTENNFLARGNWLLALAAIDITAIVGYKLLSPVDYVPLVAMVLLPRMVAVDMSLLRVATVLTLSFVLFTAIVLRDSSIQAHIRSATVQVLLVYGSICVTVLVAVYFRARQLAEIIRLVESREELLTQTMTAAEEERRQISEMIHDGPLQDVLAARRDIADYLKTSPVEPLTYALTSLGDASRRLREVTFELHPAVLDEVGLAAAVEKLVAVTADRSGIAFTADITYRDANPVDPMLFGVIRELLSNVVRHSQATTASVRMVAACEMVRIDVTDNGVAMPAAALARRLAQGHIGLASHRARVEAAGGTMRIIDEPIGAHIRVELPLRDLSSG